MDRLTPPIESLTAYPESAEAIAIAARQAWLDVESFRRPLRRCDLAQCRGMCCHLGVWLTDENAARLERLACEEAEFFRALGLELPEQVVIDGEWHGTPTGKKTAVRPTAFSRLVPDYPRHFSDTACVFHLADGRCALQVLSVARGRHPWYYKPIACWLHPISVTRVAAGAEGIRIVVFDEMTDEFRDGEYPGFTAYTFCGKTCAAGEPAFEVLAEELRFLGALAGRDLIGEIRGRETHAPPAKREAGLEDPRADEPASQRPDQSTIREDSR